MEVAQEKMVAKEEALKKREEELATAKVLTRAWENCFIVSIALAMLF